MSRHATDTVHRNDEMWAHDDGKLTADQKGDFRKRCTHGNWYCSRICKSCF